MLLKFAIKEFLDDREFKNISPVTMDRYKKVTDRFQGFCAQEEILNIEDVTGNTIKKYLLYCQNVRKNNPTTRNTTLRCIKTFFNYLEKSEIINAKQNPTSKISYAKEDIKIEVFSDHHIRQMLNYYRRIKQREKTMFAYRDYTIIVFLLGTGVRLGELCNLKWSNVDLINQVITVFGKKRMQSSIPIAEKLTKELAQYRIFCEQHFGKLGEFVFANNKNEKLGENAVKCIFKRLKDVFNFRDVRLSAHTFRHTFAHRFLMAGASVFELQKMLRHTNLDMTQRYLAIWGTALKEQNDKFNPLNFIEI